MKRKTVSALALMVIAGALVIAEPVKTGLSITTGIGSSVDAGAKEGLAQTDSLAVAVLVNKAGKIVNCVIDSAQTKINFDKAGKITTPLSTIFKSKGDLGEAYGMKKASKIGKDWSEQAEAFAQYAKGKTVAELKGMKLTAGGNPEESIKSSVSIRVTEFVAAIEKAVTNAKDMGASDTDKLGLKIETNIAKSAYAGDKEGLAQAYSTYVALSTNKDGKITSALIDGSQANVNFTKQGKITTNIKEGQKSKQELGEAYGMKKASKIGKEWNEQANSFAAYIKGKTAAEVKGIKLEQNVATDAALKSSVSIKLNELIPLVDGAIAKAR